MPACKLPVQSVQPNIHNALARPACRLVLHSHTDSFHYTSQTPYAFVLYDHSQGRIFAARDAEVQRTFKMLIK